MFFILTAVFQSCLFDGHALPSSSIIGTASDPKEKMPNVFLAIEEPEQQHIKQKQLSNCLKINNSCGRNAMERLSQNFKKNFGIIAEKKSYKHKN